MKRRSRSVAAARRRNPRPWLPWLALLVGVLIACSARAQTQPAPPPPAGPTPPEKIVPRTQPETPAGGVIVPPSHVDRGMVKHPPPQSHFPTPVLRPAPGTGSRTPVTPKK